MVVWTGIVSAAALMLVAIGSWLIAYRIQSRARARDAVADVDTSGTNPTEWQKVRRLKRTALICLVLSIFMAACVWAMFGGAILDSLAR
jgi:cbb3-type cytochrome oxidase subunit 3